MIAKFPNKLLFLLVLSCLGFWAACNSEGNEKITLVNNNDGVGQVDTAKINAIIRQLAATPPEQGGNGFDNIAAKDGWETNADFEIYGDPKAVKGNSITMALQEYPATFRTIGKESRSQVISIIGAFMYEKLLGLDTKTLKYIPGLATHWKVSPDKRTFEFRLDPRARWSDGMPVTADDIIASFKLNIDQGIEDPSNNGTYSEGYEVPEKVSPYIVRVKTKKENWRLFLYFAASLDIFPAHHLDKIDGAGYLKKYQYQPLPGTGPYQIDLNQTKQGELLVLKRRPDYWAANDRANVGTYNFDELRFIFVLDERLMLEKFKKGEFDFYQISKAQWWAEEFNPKNNDNLARGIMQKLKIYNFNPKGTSGLAFNTREEPFNDARVREAMALLWNFDQLNQELFYGEYEKCESYFQGSVYQNPNNPKSEYNPEKAIKLLAEAGWVKKDNEKFLTKNGKPFEVDLNVFGPSQERIFTPLQQDLGKVGIKLNLVTVTPQAGFEKVMKHQFKMHYQSWTGLTFPNPETSMHSKYADPLETNNITGFKNKRIDQLCELYDKSYDVQERVRLIREIDSIAVTEKHYAFGWVAPYSVRCAYWNKFDLPKCALTYTGDFEGALALWWYNPNKAAQMEKGRTDKSVKMPINPTEIDCWGRKK